LNEAAWTLKSRPEDVRDVLVVVLTVVTGATDAIGFTRLGGVFTSVMTGNMVLLGVSVGRSEGSLAMHAGLALGGYVVGTWVGARVAGRPVREQPVWPRPITSALGVQLAVFAIFGVWWEVTGGHPSPEATYALIAVNAVALGIQSGAVMRFGVPGLSTTYLTGTLTHLVASLNRRQPPRLSIAVLLALFAGAALGAVVAIQVPRYAPAIPLGVLALVLIAATRFFGTSSSSSEGNERPSAGSESHGGG
jgi:uncharacterized membrane protein YoaK (UPF0700 family)